MSVSLSNTVTCCVTYLTAKRSFKLINNFMSVQNAKFYSLTMVLSIRRLTGGLQHFCISTVLPPFQLTSRMMSG